MVHIAYYFLVVSGISIYVEIPGCIRNLSLGQFITCGNSMEVYDSLPYGILVRKLTESQILHTPVRQ